MICGSEELRSTGDRLYFDLGGLLWIPEAVLRTGCCRFNCLGLTPPFLIDGGYRYRRVLSAGVFMVYVTEFDFTLSSVAFFCGELAFDS